MTTATPRCSCMTGCATCSPVRESLLGMEVECVKLNFSVICITVIAQLRNVNESCEALYRCRLSRVQVMLYVSATECEPECVFSKSELPVCASIMMSTRVCE